METGSTQGKVTAVVGGQYGSEGKGVIVNHIANEYSIHVRTGGPNAGHSFTHQGKVFKMQIIPCGWTNPNAILVLGAGMLLDIEHLQKELEVIRPYAPDIEARLVIDPACMLLEKRHHEIEGGVDGEIHQRIGSTGEGVGAARVARVNRRPEEIRKVSDAIESYPWVKPMVSRVPTSVLLDIWISNGENVLLEGTQGSGLSLIHGPWPYVTSNDTNAAQLCADAGIAPQRVTDVILVVRSNPIRVAGNSGPLHRETSWEAISERLGKKVEEKTTVTLKTRRVGEWDDDLVARSVALNKPTCLALTFADYINPADEGLTDYHALSTETKSFILYLESFFDVPVGYVGTGGDGWKVITR